MDEYVYIPDPETMARHAAEKEAREWAYINAELEREPETELVDYRGNPILPPENLPGHDPKDVVIATPGSLAEWLMEKGEPKEDNVWACKDVFKPGALTLIVGAPMSFKSWSAFDLMVRAVEGSSWLDHPITRYDAVLYVSNEKSKSAVYERLWKVFHKKMRLADKVFVRHREDRISFGNENWAEMVRWLHEDTEGRVLVILDTLTSLAPAGYDENNLKDVSRVLTSLRSLQQGERIDVVLVHHLNAMGERPRGHTALEGEVDGFVKMDRRGRDYDEVLVKFEPKDGTASVDTYRFNADTGEFARSRGRALHIAALVEIVNWWQERNNGEGLTIGDLRSKFFTGHRHEQVEAEVNKALDELALKKEHRRYRLTNREADVITVMSEEERQDILRTRRHVGNIETEAVARATAEIKARDMFDKRAGRAIDAMPVQPDASAWEERG